MVALLVGRSRDRCPVVSLGIFFVVPPTEPCALRSTQPLKVSTRGFFWSKGGRCVWLTNYHPCSAETSRKSGALTCPEPLGPPRPVAGDLYFTVWTVDKVRIEKVKEMLVMLKHCRECYILKFRRVRADYIRLSHFGCFELVSA